jgi:hypothetical protein
MHSYSFSFPVSVYVLLLMFVCPGLLLRPAEPYFHFWLQHMKDMKSQSFATVNAIALCLILRMIPTSTLSEPIMVLVCPCGCTHR